MFAGRCERASSWCYNPFPFCDWVAASKIFLERISAISELSTAAIDMSINHPLHSADWDLGTICFQTHSECLNKTSCDRFFSLSKKKKSNNSYSRRKKNTWKWTILLLVQSELNFTFWIVENIAVYMTAISLLHTFLSFTNPSLATCTQQEDI